MPKIKYHTIEQFRLTQATRQQKWRKESPDKAAAIAKRSYIKRGRAYNKRYTFLKRLGFVKPGLGMEAAEKAYKASIDAYNKKYG